MSSARPAPADAGSPGSAAVPLAGLRRQPRQARSRARVDGILAALTDLLLDDPGADVTTGAIAERAGVPIGTLYEYFLDRDAVVDAAVDRMLRRHDEAVAPALAQAGTAADLDGLVDVLFDTYLRLYRDEPAFRALRFSSLWRHQHTEALQTHVNRVIDALAAPDAALGAVDDLARNERLGLVFTVGDAVILGVFRHDRNGDPVLEADARHLLKLAAHHVVDTPAARPARPARPERPERPERRSRRRTG